MAQRALAWLILRQQDQPPAGLAIVMLLLRGFVVRLRGGGRADAIHRHADNGFDAGIVASTGEGDRAVQGAGIGEREGFQAIGCGLRGQGGRACGGAQEREVRMDLQVRERHKSIIGQMSESRKEPETIIYVTYDTPALHRLERTTGLQRPIPAEEDRRRRIIEGAGRRAG